MTSDEECYGRRCVANEHCCPGTVCVNVDGIIGNCLFAYGRKLGELCRRDADCESGLVCDVSAVGASVCRAPMVLAKQYAEDCNTSSDCDISRGLCCQLQRRHRQAPRKVCSYFKDPLICIGTVAADQVGGIVEKISFFSEIVLRSTKNKNLIEMCILSDFDALFIGNQSYCVSTKLGVFTSLGSFFLFYSHRNRTIGGAFFGTA